VEPRDAIFFLREHFLQVTIAGSVIVLIVALLLRNVSVRWTVRRRSWMPLACAVVILSLRALALPWWEKPKPAVLDEFSYLLLADTFAAGRLANPVHPLWEHFETLFVLQQPSYASVYPPAQGLVMALGQTVLGDPWWGVWLSAGAMCVATGWMMQGWLPPFWALLGTIWFSLQIGLVSYWMNSYWGGAMAATGGALILGAIPRLIRHTRIADGVLLGFGLVLLANSRPYEGLALGAVGVLWVAVHAKRLHVLRIATAVIVAGASWTGWYCWRVTGSWHRLPAQEYMRQFAASPLFIWQPAPPEPVYRHAVLRHAHTRLLVDRQQFDDVGNGLRFTLWKLLRLGTFYLGPLILLPPMMMYWLWRTRIRFLLIASLISVAAMLITVPLQPHYAAPVAAALYVITIQSMRLLWVAGRKGNPFGRFMTLVSPLVVAIVLVIAFAAEPPRSLFRARAEVQDALLRAGGQHVVIVRYGNVHNLSEEWVYNRADIDAAGVVWARDMGPERNAELVRYYAGRKVWMVEADARPARLRELH
jgi:hypothetical protein